MFCLDWASIRETGEWGVGGGDVSEVKILDILHFYQFQFHLLKSEIGKLLVRETKYLLRFQFVQIWGF